MIVFTADLHLTPLVWQSHPNMRGDAYFALAQLVQFCQQQKPAAVILGGDVFDLTHPDSESVNQFVRAMATIANSGAAIYAVEGQHEMATPPWVHLADGVTWIGDGEIATVPLTSKKSVRVRGLNYMAGGAVKELVEDASEEYDILVVHQMAKQALPIEGQYNFEMEWVPDFVRLVLAGDYHMPFNDGRLWYPGATHMRKIDERGTKRFLTIEQAKNGTFKISAQPLRSREVVELTLVTADDVTAAVEQLSQLITTTMELRPIVFARVGVDATDAVQRLKQLAEQGLKFHLKLALISSGVEVEPVKINLDEVSLTSCLAHVIDVEQDPELFRFTSGLLTSAEPHVVCEAKKAELGL